MTWQEIEDIYNNIQCIASQDTSISEIKEYLSKNYLDLDLLDIGSKKLRKYMKRLNIALHISQDTLITYIIVINHLIKINESEYIKLFFLLEREIIKSLESDQRIFSSITKKYTEQLIITLIDRLYLDIDKEKLYDTYPENLI